MALDFAVIKTGGKQYKVKKDQIILVEKLNVKPKEKVTFDNLLGKGKVEAEILDTVKMSKVKVVKFRPKTRYKKILGHRQLKTKLRILEIK